MSTIILSLIGLLALIAIGFTVVLVLRKDVLNLGRVVGQATSGRWLLTIASAMCLLIVTGTDAWYALKYIPKDGNLKLPFESSTIFTLIGGVFTFYFLKPNDADGQDNTKKDDKKVDPPAP